MKTRHFVGAVTAAVVLWAGVSSAPAQVPVFSLDRASPSLAPAGANADDLFSPAFPTVVVPGTAGAGFEVDAFSFQQPFMPKSEADILAVYFSVDRAAIGWPGTAVWVETAGAPLSGLASADVFMTSAPFLAPSNVQVFDGNGVATPPNGAPGLVLIENPAGDNLNGLDHKAITSKIYWSVDPVTAGAYGAGATAADVFVGNTGAGYDTPPVVPYALAAQLGLVAGDDIDALVVFDNGDAIYQPGMDALLFSLAPGSPSLLAIPGPGGAATAGDILQDPWTFGGGPLPGIIGPAELLGLQTIRSGLFGQDDNLNALSMDVVPEPATIVALISGGAAVGVLALVWRRRRAKKAAEAPEPFFQE